MAFDTDKFATHLRARADKTGYGYGKCAKYVREALAMGGFTPPGNPPLHAKDWGPVLLRGGFRQLPEQPDPDRFKPLKGDIAVIQATSSRTSGHIQAYDGTNWTSDFIQRRGFWPGPEYRTERPSHAIFRR